MTIEITEVIEPLGIFELPKAVCKTVQGVVSDYTFFQYFTKPD